MLPSHLNSSWFVGSGKGESKNFRILELIQRRQRSMANAVDDSFGTEELKYIEALTVNVSNFVSVKLSGRNNYHLWRAQMLCLIQSQGLLHMITKDDDMTGKYCNLVKGWIFSTINDQVLQKIYYMSSLPLIWSILESTYENPLAKGSDCNIQGFVFGKESVTDIPEIEKTEKNRLYEAAVDGCWWKAKSVLKIHKNAATEATSPNGDTILHVAVEMGQNYFVEKLLDFLKDGKDIEKVNNKGRTALHIAAMIGNEYAAQLLVEKRKELLMIHDHNGQSPFDIAFANMKINISAYLLKSAPPSDSGPYSDVNPEYAICAAILAKEYDLAETLLNKFSDSSLEYGFLLMLMVVTFPAELSFLESLIYPSFHNIRHKTIMRGSLLFHYNFLDKCVDDISRVVKICNNSCCSWLGKNSLILFVPVVTLYPIYKLVYFLILVLHLTFSMLYFLLWKVLEVTVHPIKNIDKKEKEYKNAKKILSLICNQMGTSNDGYCRPLFEAIRQGTYEVVDEILFTSPTTINCKDEEGYTTIQLAITNRAEKVYNLIYHVIERTRSYREMTDFYQNNLLHLAGRLAPSFVLGRTTGAALQLQREILWYEEVKKLMLPIELITKNSNNETPAMVFTREHRDLLKQGENWMKTTAESCSITAALIVTVVFAAAITVPGGNNQESGIPVFKKEIAFTIFAVSNAFSLFTAATALLLFLSILITRYSEKDFLVSLPRRLILGLLTLFLSTTAMMVAFGAILFLVFCDQRPWMLAPICVSACLPISVIVTIKLPLLVDLFQSTYIPIFGKKSYLDSCKVNRKNTIYTE